MCKSVAADMYEVALLMSVIIVIFFIFFFTEKFPSRLFQLDVRKTFDNCFLTE